MFIGSKGRGLKMLKRTTAKVSGTGLGMAIVKSLVDLREPIHIWVSALCVIKIFYFFFVLLSLSDIGIYSYFGVKSC